MIIFDDLLGNYDLVVQVVKYIMIREGSMDLMIKISSKMREGMWKYGTMSLWIVIKMKREV